MSKINRRDFINKTGTVATLSFLVPNLIFSGSDDEHQIQQWREMMKDPVYDTFREHPDLNKFLKLFPRPRGDAAIDPGIIEANIKKLKTSPDINTGYPFLDLSIKTGLAHIDATFQGDHPKYGVGRYGEADADGFPPTIIAVVDALSSWGLNSRAAELFHYWLMNFVKEDGTIDYYGPSISEYGQLLFTAAILEIRSGGNGWLGDGFPKLNSIAEYLLQLHAAAVKEDGLIAGVPEADTRDQVAKYFHNNAWAVNGLESWATLCDKIKAAPTPSIEVVRSSAQRLRADTLDTIQRTWPDDPGDWWLRARTGNISRPKCMTDGIEASYTNYRYWPELLSSELLPEDMANRVINARLNGGGQFCGMTRFLDWLDDWPLANYLFALWKLGRKKDFLLSLFGHIAYHQCERHLTAFEQINFPGDPKGSKRADYCLPCQLVAARAGRLLNRS